MLRVVCPVKPPSSRATFFISCFQLLFKDIHNYLSYVETVFSVHSVRASPVMATIIPLNIAGVNNLLYCGLGWLQIFLHLVISGTYVPVCTGYVLEYVYRVEYRQEHVIWSDSSAPCHFCDHLCLFYPTMKLFICMWFCRYFGADRGISTGAKQPDAACFKTQCLS